MRYISLLTLFLSAPAFSQSTGWRTDTLLASDTYSPGFDFAPHELGKLSKKNDSVWNFYADSSYRFIEYVTTFRIYHPPAGLFDDCLLFDAINAAQADAIEHGGHTWVIKRGDSYYMRDYPVSMRNAIDTNHLHTTFQEGLATDELKPEIIQTYVQPFYFRKYEVSNKEYREFVQWVQDSIVRTKLGYVQSNGMIDWYKKIDWQDTHVRKTGGLLIKKAYRVEIDVSKLNYQFKNIPSEYGKPSINIYPDTLSWCTDFSYSYNEPMTNMYFWHPAYDDYPVVGVNYWQCLAFLEWKSRQLEQQMNASGKKYHIVCALPSNAQWDLASTAFSVKNGYALNGDKYQTWADGSWLTDLKISTDTGWITVEDANASVTNLNSNPGNGDHIYLVENKKSRPIAWYNPNTWTPYEGMLNRDLRTQGDYISDGYFHPGPTHGLTNEYFSRGKSGRDRRKELSVNERFQAHFDKMSGIYYLDGNVSEWTSDDLDSTWRPVFIKHQQLIANPNYEQFVVTRSIDNYYYKLLPAHGKMVRGGNWFDERYSYKYGKNTAGQNLKTFVDPNKAHCTVGFRYVIYVYPVEN